MAKVMAKVLNLVDDANDDGLGVALVVDVVVLMTRTPEHC
jgi:hypothetical protein